MEVVYDFVNGHYNSDSADNAKHLVTFEKHKCEVWFCSLHPNASIAATGSRDGKVYIWDMETNAVYFEKPGRPETITGVEFSMDASYFLVSHAPCIIEVFSFSKEDDEPIKVEKIKELTLDVEAPWVRWHTTTDTIYCGTFDGNIKYWSVENMDTVHTLGSIPSCCEVADIGRDGSRLLVGHSNGTVTLWNLLRRSLALEVGPDRGFSEKIYKVSVQLNTSLYLACTYKLILVMTDTEPLWTLDLPANTIISSIASPVEGRSPLLAIGTTTNRMVVYNIMSRSIVEAIEFEERYGGVTVIKWLAKEVIAVGTAMGDIFAINVRYRHKKFSIHGHTQCIIDFTSQPSTRKLVTASADGTLNVHEYRPLNR